MTTLPRWSTLLIGAPLVVILTAPSVSCEGERPTVSQPATPPAEGTSHATRGGTGGPRPPAPVAESAQPPRAIADYGPPAPTMFFVAGLKGYTEPCGCTAGLHVGGIDRLAGFTEAAREMQPASVFLDAGDTLFDEVSLAPHLIDQKREQARIIAELHRHLGTLCTTPGPRDLALGLSFYLELIEPVTEIVSANVTAADGTPIGAPHLVHELGGTRIGIIGASDPLGFEEIDDVRVTDPIPAVERSVRALEEAGVSTIVLLMQGDLTAARVVSRQVPGIDFAIVGRDPAETDEVTVLEETAILQVYDQGRYVGILKLYPDQGGTYRDARVEDREAIARIDRRLAYLRSQLHLLPPSLQGEEPEIVLTMHRQLDELEAEREVARHENLVIPEQGGAFLYWPVPLERGYPVSAEIASRLDELNRSLRDLHAHRTDIVPLGDGDIAYAGGERCVACHVPAHEMWLTTPHARAIDTLVEQDKQFDEVCVSCHVTGFRQPGGSVTGNYNGLENVQCESCHGPGGRHVLEPPGHIEREAPAALCAGCHNSSHSPQFTYDRYRPLILGPGHGL